MKDYKHWLLKQITECNTHILHLQDKRNRAEELQQNVNNSAHKAYIKAYNEFREQGLTKEEAEKEAMAAYDYVLNTYSDNEIECIDNQIEYYHYMAETYRLAYKGLELEEQA